MPYIHPADRIAPNLIALEDVHPKTPAELTYCIYKLACGFAHDGEKWEVKAEVIKALECAKLEYYRRVIAPHEDLAIDRNGDVN